MAARDSGGEEILIDSALGRSRVLFGPLFHLADLADPGRSVIVTDAAVRRYVPPEFPPERVVEVPRGEAAKSLAGLEALFARFLDLELGRDGIVVGLGGGCVSDLAGFAASTWLRGVDFGFAPTTVLAMVDASVGGKNGIDFRNRKNLVGTFRQPRFVLMDPGVLASLPSGEIASGLAEAVKHAVIEGPEHFALLEQAIPPRPAGEPYRSPEDPRVLSAVIRSSVRLKARIVSADIRESGERRKLNLGHTIGHAVETATGLPHGACVAVGLVCALDLAGRRGGSETDARRIRGLLDRLGLPLSLEEARSAAGLDADVFRETMVRALRADKKRAGGKVLFALPRALGSVDVEPVDLAEIEDFVREAP